MRAASCSPPSSTEASCTSEPHEGVTRADVLASQAELETEIDVEATRQRLAELEAHGELDETELEAVKREMQKAQARLKLAG